MHRRIRMILLATLVLALAVPFGTALTIERRSSSPGPVAMTAVQTDFHLPNARQPFSDAAMLMLTGCLLIAIAAAVRRA
ncbi:MAG TPA: hypothetical protein VNK41_06255 [Vicinamibacterales bacterium]|nr:hypothetical protein [Vicinamibacterales bacterium]